ncbi:MAG: hydantoinase B/oxoprolinase family protein [Oligoflexia bacterium]|nr:hydantoinase B/oxoprolinase family protein [Oligoflexia bacterium]
MELLDLDLIAAQRSLHLWLDQASKETAKIRACAFFDSQKELIHGAGSFPHFFPALEQTLKSAYVYLTPSRKEIIISNDPLSGQPSLADFGFLTPVYSESEQPVGYVGISLSCPELLKAIPPEDSSNQQEEGFRIPPSPLMNQGMINPEIANYLSQSGLAVGDVSLILQSAADLVLKLSDQAAAWLKSFAPGKSSKVLSRIKLSSEKALKAALRSFPDGEFEFHDFIDSDELEPKPLKVALKLSVHDEHVHLTFKGSSKQTLSPFNLNAATTLGVCSWVLSSLVKYPICFSAGLFRAFSLETPEGTLLNARFPAPTLAAPTETALRVVDVMLGCLAKAFPFEVPAMGGGTMNSMLIESERLRFFEFLGSGSGSSREAAGVSAITSALINSPLTDPEELEKLQIFQVVQNSLRDGSGAEGRFKAGDGQTRSYKFLKKSRVMLLMDRWKNKPHGLFGGSSGSAVEVALLPLAGRREVIRERRTLNLNPGDTLFVSTPGGGAWGKPEEPIVGDD